MTTLAQKLGLVGVIANPGRYSYKRPGLRRLYKLLYGALTLPRKAERRSLAATLPALPEEFRIPWDQGFKRVSRQAAASLTSRDKVLATCRRIIEQGNSFARSKSYLRQMISDDDVAKYPEFFEFALDPTLLSAATEYLGELPVLTSIKLLHSPPELVDPSGSQLFHCDFDDDRQVKLFLNVSDVDINSGPLTVLPAAISTALRNRIKYRFGNATSHVPDSTIREADVGNHEVPLMGESGSLCLVDTSRCFHFGSRVATKDRYIFYLQYVTLTSFLYHPTPDLVPSRISQDVRRFPYRSIPLPGLVPIQRAILDGRAVPRTRAH